MGNSMGAPHYGFMGYCSNLWKLNEKFMGCDNSALEFTSLEITVREKLDGLTPFSKSKACGKNDQ